MLPFHFIFVTLRNVSPLRALYIKKVKVISSRVDVNQDADIDGSLRNVAKVAVKIETSGDGTR